MPQARKTTGRRTARRTSPARTARAAPHGTDAVSVLRRQHDEARKLFQELAVAEHEGRRQLFERLADALSAHAKVEEELLYPEVARLGMAEMARDAEEEHLIAKRLLADMLEKDLDEAVFDAKRRVLEVEVSRHLEEEEAALLPKLKRQLDRERLDEMGREIEQRFQDLLQREPRRELPRETDAAPTLH